MLLAALAYVVTISYHDDENYEQKDIETDAQILVWKIQVISSFKARNV